MEPIEIKMLDMLLSVQEIDPQVMEEEYEELSDDDPIKLTVKQWLEYRGIYVWTN